MVNEWLKITMKLHGNINAHFIDANKTHEKALLYKL
jgi:hypothetical protein